jgi:hypothetical protein
MLFHRDLYRVFDKIILNVHYIQEYYHGNCYTTSMHVSVIVDQHTNEFVNIYKLITYEENVTFVHTSNSDY